MKFDTIIIGGGLSGLTAGITLAAHGKRVAILATGQSKLHLMSGSLDLLSYNIDGTPVLNPIEAAAALPPAHPYHRVGIDNLAPLATQAKHLLTDAGLDFYGNEQANHLRVTPIGYTKPTWLSLTDYLSIQQPSTGKLWRKAMLVDINGYTDFPVALIKHNLEAQGLSCNVKTITTPQFEALRLSYSEMRATNIARILADRNAVNDLSVAINSSVDDENVVLMPAVVGVFDDSSLKYLRRMLTRPLHCLATLPPAVPGVRIQTLLRKRFLNLGGIFMLGNTVRSASIKDGKISSIQADKLPDQSLTATNYILATGSFVGNGLVSTPQSVIEPIMNLDVDADNDRDQWTRPAFNAPQPYMEYGVRTDDKFTPMIGGELVTNLHAIGAVLSGHNSIALADAAGVDMTTALTVCKQLLNITDNQLITNR